jgi:hypothetical protein
MLSSIPPPLTAGQRLLVHQVHTIKVGADVTASMLSLVLFWHGHRRSAMFIHYALPAPGSAIVLSRGDLPQLATTPAGRYVQRHMPPAAQALRLAGDALTIVGARRRTFGLIVAGLAIVVAGWSHGLLPATRYQAGPSDGHAA